MHKKKYIQQYNTLIPNGYNVSIKGGYGIIDSPLHEDTKRKIGIKSKGRIHSKEIREKISINTKIAMSDEIIKNKLRNSLKGRIPWNKNKPGCFSNESLEKMSKSHKGQISSRKGVILSEETKNKISKSKKGKPLNRDNSIYSNIIREVNNKRIFCIYCNKEFHPGNYSRYHGNKCKQKNSN
jgi:hypothetical protein